MAHRETETFGAVYVRHGVCTYRARALLFLLSYVKTNQSKLRTDLHGTNAKATSRRIIHIDQLKKSKKVVGFAFGSAQCKGQFTPK